MSADDVRDYRPQWRDPLEATFGGRRIVTFPPPGSGGVVLEILGILGADDLAAMDPGARAHLLAGAMAQGFADRATWYGDTNVPVKSLLEPKRLQALRARIPPDRVIAPTVAMKPDAGTAHVSVVDGYGNAVAITTTINTSFGSGVVAGSSGIVLNNEMDDFSAAPGAPNTYGLVGSTAVPMPPIRSFPIRTASRMRGSQSLAATSNSTAISAAIRIRSMASVGSGPGALPRATGHRRSSHWITRQRASRQARGPGLFVPRSGSA